MIWYKEVRGERKDGRNNKKPRIQLLLYDASCASVRLCNILFYIERCSRRCTNMVVRRYRQYGILLSRISGTMVHSKEKDGLNKSLEFRSVDDEIHVFDICGKQLGRIVYFEGNYSYVLWPAKGVMLTFPELLEITDKIKEMLQPC